MKYKSQLALIVATQLGTIQGKVESTFVIRLSNYINQFSKSCPNVNTLKQVISLLNNISNSISTLERTKSTFRNTSDKLTPVINSLTTLTTVLRTLPIPTAVAGVGLPVGFTNRYAELLVNASSFLDSLKEEQRSIVKLLDSTEGTTVRVSQLIETLNSLLTSCTETNPELVPYLEQFQQTQNNLSTSESSNSNFNLGLGPNNSYRAANGKIYFFEIVEDSTIEAPVSRRLAVARDFSGVIVMKGEPSFSSSTKVLIDELKLRIERQLP